MANVIDVASYLIALRNADEQRGEYYSLSNLKIQKLLYYCQGGHFQLANAPIIEDEQFEAWRYGPVAPSIYRHFSQYGQNDIPEDEGLDYNLQNQEMNTVQLVWNKLKDYDAYSLVNATHNEAPWREAFGRQESIIPQEAIAEFFRGE